MGLTEQPVNGAADLSVLKIFSHSAYHPEGLSYDIALIKLTQPLTFNGESLLLISDPNYFPRLEYGYRPGCFRSSLLNTAGRSSLSRVFDTVASAAQHFTLLNELIISYGNLRKTSRC